jgi:AcrR family transcriptional regulator
MSIAARGRIRQKRSQKTYDALVETAFRLLEKSEFEDISIAELAQKAGYSVGAFYSRFKSKDELFDALVLRHIEDRTAARRKQFATSPDATLVHDVMEDTINYYWARRQFWRAALIRSIRDLDFWEPLRKLGHELADLMIERIATRAKRPLTATEETNVRFAVQLALGTINNTIINRPGPIFMDQKPFVDNLARAFRLVSGYDDLAVGSRSTAKKRA